MKNKHVISLCLLIALFGYCNYSIAANYNNGNTYTAQYSPSSYYSNQQTSVSNYNQQQNAQRTYTPQGNNNTQIKYGNTRQNSPAPYAAPYNSPNVPQPNYGNMQQNSPAPYAAPYNTQNVPQPNYGNMQQNSPAPYAAPYNTQNANPVATYGNVLQNSYAQYPNSYPSYGNSNNYNQYSQSQTYNNGQNYNNYGNPQNSNLTYTPYNMPTKANPDQKIPLYKNQSTVDLANMVNQIGDRLLQKSNINTKVVFKLDSKLVQNAHVDVYGTITVYKGLIEYCEDGDELAFVIGHEIGHATKYHGLKSTAVNTIEAQLSPMLKAKIMSKFDSKFGRIAASTVYDAAEQGAKSYYERGQEKDADLLSVDFMVAAGYNPLAGISILNKIGTNYPDFFENHPSTDKRVVTMYNYIKQKYPQYLDTGYDTYSYKQAIANYVK